MSRSIPACAGEPDAPGVSCYLLSVYPRVCGGATLSQIHIGDGSGLSPRVRGSHHYGYWSWAGHGSIPACAGEPSLFAGAFRTRTVYPRVCGGAAAPAIASSKVSGLSPRVRGSQPPPATTYRRRRSIPACAGEPQASGSEDRQRLVYPRVCGGAA